MALLTLQADLPGRLSDDLWAKILVQLEGGVTDGLCLRIMEPYSMAEEQSAYHRLRLVCRKFNTIFKEHRRLLRGLVLSPALTKEALPSLLTWLGQHRSSVQMFAAYCDSPCLEAALSRLQAPQTLLDNVFLSGCSNPAIQLMTGLTALTYVELVSPKDIIDLSPLEGLAHLQKLHLTDGNFVCDSLPASLTNLTLDDAKVAASATRCATSLRKLRAIDSSMIGFHPDGLSACSAVEDLQCRQCFVGAASDENTVDLRNGMSILLPTAISALTALSHLSLGLANLAETQNGQRFDLEPLYLLTSLQDLFVRSDSVSLGISAGFSNLQKLTSLYLSACNWEDQDEDDMSIKLDVDWSTMHALQQLVLHNWQFRCNSNILGLTTLQKLSAVTFDNSRPFQDMVDEESSFKCFSLLICRLARFCPGVHLSIDQEPVDTVS